jgi:hypothetical protein
LWVYRFLGKFGLVWVDLLVAAAIVIDFMLISALAGFGADSVAALDLAAQLNGKIPPYLMLEGVICFLPSAS